MLLSHGSGDKAPPITLDGRATVEFLIGSIMREKGDRSWSRRLLWWQDNYSVLPYRCAISEDMPLLSSSSLQIRFYMSPYIEWEVGSYWVWAVVAAEAGDHDQNLMESVHAALQGLVQGWGLVPHYWMLIGRPGATEAEHDMAMEGKGPERPPDDCTDNMMRTGHCLYCASTCQDLREHFLGAHGWTHGRHGRSLGHSCPAA